MVFAHDDTVQSTIQGQLKRSISLKQALNALFGEKIEKNQKKCLKSVCLFKVDDQCRRRWVHPTQWVIKSSDYHFIRPFQWIKPKHSMSHNATNVELGEQKTHLNWFYSCPLKKFFHSPMARRQIHHFHYVPIIKYGLPHSTCISCDWVNILAVIYFIDRPNAKPSKDIPEFGTKNRKTQLTQAICRWKRHYHGNIDCDGPLFPRPRHGAHGRKGILCIFPSARNGDDPANWFVDNVFSKRNYMHERCARCAAYTSLCTINVTKICVIEISALVCMSISLTGLEFSCCWCGVACASVCRKCRMPWQATNYGTDTDEVRWRAGNGWGGSDRNGAPEQKGGRRGRGSRREATTTITLLGTANKDNHIIHDNSDDNNNNIIILSSYLIILRGDSQASG